MLKKASTKLHNFSKKMIGSRVLDLYLKYRGIKILTSATLVPLALIMGKDIFQEHIKAFIQKGGKIPKELPIIDDPLLGTYLKLTGLSTIALTPNTLLPLGLVMVVYDLFVKNQKGGGIKNDLNKFVKKILGNRILDLYLKYTGIKMLTASTLVPFALILGKNVFEKNVLKGQKGGNILKKKLPILDDPLFGTYVKFMGLSTLNIGPQTLVPLGILIVLYELYN